MSVSKSQKSLPQVACPRCFLSTLARPWRKKCLHCGTELPIPADREETGPSLEESSPRSRGKHISARGSHRRRKVA